MAKYCIKIDTPQQLEILTLWPSLNMSGTWKNFHTFNYPTAIKFTDNRYKGFYKKDYTTITFIEWLKEHQHEVLNGN